MKIKRFLTGMIGTNTYLVINEDTRTGILIDPAAFSKELEETMAKEQLHLAAVFLTHGHFDHIMGIEDVLNQYNVPVYAHREEKELLNDATQNLSAMYGKGYTFSHAVYVEDGEELEVAGFLFQVIYTPGHTKGGCCYYCFKEGILFSGDTLFCGSVGRTDFPTGSSSVLIRSVEEKLMVLPDGTKVYPGHMEETTIAFEKRNNPFLS